MKRLDGHWILAGRAVVTLIGVATAVFLFAGGSIGAADTTGITNWEVALLLAPAVLVFAGAAVAIKMPRLAIGAFAAAFLVAAIAGFGPLSALPLLLLGGEALTLWPPRS